MVSGDGQCTGRDTVTPGVYTIENIENGHLYVGSAVNISRRGKPKSPEHRTRMLTGAAAAKAVASLMYHVVFELG